MEEETSLKDAEKEISSQQCLFCALAARKIPAKVVFEDEHCIAMLDIKPAVPGHLLVLPKDHVMILAQLQEKKIEHLARVIKQLSQVLLRAVKARGTTTFLAQGSYAGQKAPHVMFHIIPRYEEDKLNFDIPQNEIANISELITILRPALERIEALPEEALLGKKQRKEKTEEDEILSSEEEEGEVGGEREEVQSTSDEENEEETSEDAIFSGLDFGSIAKELEGDEEEKEERDEESSDEEEGEEERSVNEEREREQKEGEGDKKKQKRKEEKEKRKEGKTKKKSEKEDVEEFPLDDEEDEEGNDDVEELNLDELSERFGHGL